MKNGPGGDDTEAVRIGFSPRKLFWEMLRVVPGCVEFYKTERSVRTASSEQVRQEIYREGLDQWKHFEAWLGPLKDALGDALTRYRTESGA